MIEALNGRARKPKKKNCARLQKKVVGEVPTDSRLGLLGGGIPADSRSMQAYVVRILNDKQSPLSYVRFSCEF